MIDDIEEFIKYFHGQRRRTQWVLDRVPPEKAAWRPWPGEPSLVEIVCRIAAGHLMYATVVAHDYWVVDDYEAFTTDWDRAVHYLDTRTEEALDLLRVLPNNVMNEKRRKPAPGDLPTSAWRYLMAMLEHEVTSRTQIRDYLMLLNVDKPELNAISIDAVRAALSQDGHEQGGP
jgi:hypothetical protein